MTSAAIPGSGTDALGAQPRRSSAPGANMALMLFVTSSLLISMSVSQLDVLPPGSLRYWLLVVPAAILPLTGLREMARTLVRHGWWLLAFLLSAGTWHLAHGDTRAVFQLGLLVWVATWVASEGARLNVVHIMWLYVALVAIGFFVYVLTDLNGYGLLPGFTLAEYSDVWRVSFFPNIAYTGLLSLIVIMILTRKRSDVVKYRLVLVVAVYFLVASFVRAALVALVIYVVLRWLFARRATPGYMFGTALIVGFGVNLAIAGSLAVLEHFQQYAVISRLFLRGETQLSSEEILYQIYRPWLWWAQLKLFASSPYLMGWGTFNFNELIADVALDPGFMLGDTVSVLTRLLAAYGIPGALFTAFLIARLGSAARAGDAWSCACFAPVLLITLQWGSVFHPTDALFVLYLMTVVRGSAAFLDPVRDDPQQRPAAVVTRGG